MSGKALVEGITYLSDKYSGGDRDDVKVVISEYGDNTLHVYLESDSTVVFSDYDIQFMAALGFDHSPATGDDFEPDAYQDEDYSFFSIDV